MKSDIRSNRDLLKVIWLVGTVLISVGCLMFVVVAVLFGSILIAGTGPSMGLAKLVVIIVLHAYPLFGLSLLILMMGCIAQRFVRRNGPLYRRTYGLCVQCGYDLSISEQGCPECGALKK